jgi:FtsP/CotA-like multicopper oxidase with cupredoxin domain
LVEVVQLELTRRDVLKLGALGSAALVLPIERGARALVQQANRLDPARLPAVGQLPFRVPPVARPIPAVVTVPGTWIDPAHPAGTAPVSIAIDYYASHMRQANVPILPGLPPTMIWGYGGITPGPTIHAERGRPVLVRHFNDLSEQHPVLRYGRPQTSVHLHGNETLPQHDGYASDTTDFGQYKDYWYPSIHDAASLWYHDHGVHHTASNAYMGLAALYPVHDAAERASGLPLRGPTDQYGNPYDAPLVIRDALFDANGQLIFDDHDSSGAFGDVNLVNGVPWPEMRVEPRQYRFRILDGATSRSYELSLSVNGSSTRLPLTVVGTDGGLMEIAQATTSLRVGMAERYEIVIDFSNLAGKTLRLTNQSPENNIDFATTPNVMQFRVGTTVTNTANNATVPGKRLLQETPAVMALTPDPTMVRRSFDFKRESGEWTINGKTWADVIASGFVADLAEPKLNAVEVWTLANPHGGWFHPVHIHLIDFKILTRTGGRNRVFGFERGPKDTVYLAENETVTVIARLGPQPGRYMMHCHNLVHEDHDMMHQLWVRPPDGYDPMGSRAAAQPADGSLNLPAVAGGPQFPPT